jgi:hypothetical protein
MLYSSCRNRMSEFRTGTCTENEARRYKRSRGLRTRLRANKHTDTKMMPGDKEGYMY